MAHSGYRNTWQVSALPRWVTFLRCRANPGDFPASAERCGPLFAPPTLGGVVPNGPAIMDLSSPPLKATRKLDRHFDDKVLPVDVTRISQDRNGKICQRRLTRDKRRSVYQSMLTSRRQLVQTGYPSDHRSLAVSRPNRPNGKTRMLRQPAPFMDWGSCAQRAPPAARTCFSSSVQLITARKRPPRVPRRSMMNRPSRVTS